MALVVLFLGGISIGLYSGYSARRTLAAAADSAAQAGANALDEAAYRRDGTRQLDPALAEQLATAALATQNLPAAATGAVSADNARVTVVIETEVGLGLLGIFAPGEPLQVRVTAIGTPRAPGAAP